MSTAPPAQGPGRPRLFAELRRGPSWLSHRHFCRGVLIACTVVAALACWPALESVLRDPPPALAAADYDLPSVGAAFHGRFFRLCAVCAAGIVCLYLACRRHRYGRGPRAVALVVALLCFPVLCLVHDRLTCGERALDALASGDVFELQWRGLERLRIVECPPVHRQLDAFAARAEFRSSGIDTFSALHRAVMQRYARHRSWLANRWDLNTPADEPRLKTLFVMNFVAGMWNFGNARDVTHTGCVLSNEQHFDAAPLAARSYLESEIACCTDYAYLTKTLLDREGIENRLTAIPGHLFNEVRLDGRWCIVDSSCNLFIESGWDELYAGRGDDTITALMFPHPNAAERKSGRYRAVIGRFRLLMLMRLVNHPEMLHQVSHPDLPARLD